MTDFAKLVATIDSSGVKRGEDALKRFTHQAETTERKTRGSTDRIAANYERSGSKIATTVGRITGRLVALGAAALSVGQAGRTLAQFEGAMSKVSAITGATGAELDKLRATAQRLGSTTEFSATQAADALTFLGMAGFEASESMAALPAVLDLATASGLGLAQSADIASNVLSGFGMEAKNSAAVADVLAAASTSANTSVSQLGQAMSTAAPIAASLGVGLEETAASIGVMSDAGIQGERAGTALRGVLASLANPTKQARDALSDYGLTAEQVNPETEGLANVMARLRDAGLSTADAMTIFGREAASGALVLVKGSDRFREFTNELRSADGAANDMASTMRDNLGGDFDSLVSSVQGLILALGEAGLTAVLRTAVQGATALVRGITGLISAISTGASAVSGFVRNILGLATNEEMLQRAIDNGTLAMGDQIAQTQQLSAALGTSNKISLEAARVKLAHAKAEQELLRQMRERNREQFFEDQGLSDLLMEAERRRNDLEELLSTKARAKDLGIDLPGITQDTASWNAEIENAERLLAQTLSQIEAIKQSARDKQFVSAEDAARMAELEELAEQLGVAIDGSKDGVVDLNGEVVEAITLTERLGMAAGEISFDSATASAITLSRQLGVSLEIANKIDRAMDKQAGISRGAGPERLGSSTFDAPSVGLGPGLGTMMGETLTMPDGTSTRYEAMVASLDSVSVAAGGAASSQAQLNEAARQAQQILGQVSREAVTYADVVTHLSELLKSGKISQEQFNAAVDAAEEKFKEVGKSAGQVGNNLGSMFSSAIQNAESFSDALSEILSKLADMALDAAFSGLFGGIGGGGGGLFGGAIIPGILHDGGTAGKDGYSHARSFPASMFVGAPRYHSGGTAGLRPNEVPAILEKGERVIPNGAQGAGGGGRIEVVARVENGSIVQDVQQISGDVAVQVMQSGFREYDRQLPQRFKQIQSDPRVRRG